MCHQLSEAAVRDVAALDANLTGAKDGLTAFFQEAVHAVTAALHSRLTHLLAKVDDVARAKRPLLEQRLRVLSEAGVQLRQVLHVLCDAVHICASAPA